MSNDPPTVRDLARAAGLSTATVSLALHNSPRIKPETRARVHDLAKSLGYRPNPHFSDMMSTLRKGRRSLPRETIAFVSKIPRDALLQTPLFRQHYIGASQRAADLGFAIEFHVVSANMSEARLGSILRHRGIRGIIVLPQMDPEGKSRGYEQLPWQHFASVAIGFSCPVPATHRVMPDQIHALHASLQAGERLGYQRPGLAIEGWKDNRVRNHWTAGFRSYQDRHYPPKKRIPPLSSAQEPRSLLAWYNRWKPDFIIGSDVGRIVSVLASAGFQSPRDFGYATLSKSIEGEWAFHAGVWEPSSQVGAAAIDVLAACLYRNEIGLPSYPQIVLLPVNWMDGDSAPPRSFITSKPKVSLRPPPIQRMKGPA